MAQAQELDGMTVDDLLDVAGELDITGRHDMRKNELKEAIRIARADGEQPDEGDDGDGGSEDEADETADDADEEPDEEEPGPDVVPDEDLPWDVAEVEVGDMVNINVLSRPVEVTEVHEGNPYEVVMETTRGGRHMLRVPYDGEARFMRWRKGDQRWMYNAEYPEYLHTISEYDVQITAYGNITIEDAEMPEQAVMAAQSQVDAGEYSPEFDLDDVDETDDGFDVGFSVFINETVEAHSPEEAAEVALDNVGDLGDAHSPTVEKVTNTRTDEEHTNV